MNNYYFQVQPLPNRRPGRAPRQRDGRDAGQAVPLHPGRGAKLVAGLQLQGPGQTRQSGEGAVPRGEELAASDQELADATDGDDGHR